MYPAHTLLCEAVGATVQLPVGLPLQRPQLVDI
jgi:hypothetical protein